MSTSAGTNNLGIALAGRQSKVIVTDYSFGDSKLLYSTPSIFFAGRIGSRDILFLFGDSTQTHEAALQLSPAAGVRTTSASVRFSNAANGITTITFLAGIKGLVTVFESPSQIILFADPVTAASFWAPVIPGASQLATYWQFGSNSTVLVGGPYLVRNATIQGSQLRLTGDLNASVPLTVIAPNNVATVTWNGIIVSGLRASSQSSILRGQLSMTARSSKVTVPTLTNWKFADSLPEIQANFSDAQWITANHTTTNIITKPLFGDGRVLYGI